MDKIINATQVGYVFIKNYLKKHNIDVLPNYRESYIVPKGGQRIIQTPSVTKYYYRRSYKPKDGLWGQVEFAIKYEGINLEILKQFFSVVSEKEVEEYVKKLITGKHNRIVWFLYEFLVGKRLAIPDLQKKIAYIDVLSPKKYYTSKAIKCRRYRIKDNLLGNARFCPMLRKTEALNNYEKLKLDEKAIKIIEQFDPSIISRAVQYLYAKETMSSYEIEKERPNKKRIAKFIMLLQDIANIQELTKEKLIELQNSIVDPRFKDKDYRNTQNYVGQSFDFNYERIHYISPKKEDVPLLMDGLLNSYKRMKEGGVHPVVIASIVSFAFVFIHPFLDGNGRIHRFLVHYILAKENFTPPNVIFPVSATILDNIKQYDECLESFSKPLLDLINFEVDQNGVMTVNNETRIFYQYSDFTTIVEYLFQCIEKTIIEKFKHEVNFLLNYDKAKNEIQDIIDMPDRLIDLFIKFTAQNKGILSKHKRDSYFSFLTQDELSSLEEVIKNYFV